MLRYDFETIGITLNSILIRKREKRDRDLYAILTLDTNYSQYLTMFSHSLYINKKGDKAPTS